MGIRLLGDRVLVKLERPMTERVVDGHTIYYPEGSHGASTELHSWATVEQVGPGAWAKKGSRRIPIDLRVGDRIMMTWYLSQVETNKALAQVLGKDKVIIRPEDVLCVEPSEASTGQSAS